MYKYQVFMAKSTFLSLFSHVTFVLCKIYSGLLYVSVALCFGGFNAKKTKNNQICVGRLHRIINLDQTNRHDFMTV